MIHKFEIKTETLSQIFGIVNALVDEVRVRIDKKSWKILCVDPARVAILDMKIKKDTFEKYSYKEKEELEIGVDVDKIKAILKLCDKHDITVFKGGVVEGGFGVEREHRYDIIAKLGKLKYHITGFDPRGLSDPKLPEWKLPIEREVNSAELIFGVENAQQVAEYIRITTDEWGMRIRADGDEDHIEMPLNSEGSEEPHESLFSLDYLFEAVKVIPTESLKVGMSTDHPVAISYNLLGGGITVKYALAPRIEAE